MSATDTSEYIAILEKTNQQLSLWYNPYGLMVAILTLLIAVIAIGVSIALWKHSRDQREKADRFFEEQARIIKEKNESVKKVEEKLQQLIVQYERQLKDTTIANKKEVQKTIDELRREKATLATYIGPASVYGQPSNVISDLQVQIQALLAQISALQSPSTTQAHITGKSRIIKP